MALTNKLNAIGDAIREKTGKTELLTLDEMPIEIKSIQGGGGEDPLVPERIRMTVGSSYDNGFLSNDSSDGYWKNDWWKYYYPIFIKTLKYLDINPYTLEEFAYNAKEITDECKDLQMNFSSNYGKSMFYGCTNMTHAPKISGTIKYGGYMFAYCYNLKDVSGLDGIKLSHTYTNGTYHDYSSIFQNCYALRSVDSIPNFKKEIGRYPLVGYSSSTIYEYKSAVNSTFENCVSLDEITGIGAPMGPEKTMDDNMYGNHVDNCTRLKRYTFDTNEDGTPIEVGVIGTDYNYSCYKQILDFSKYVGYAPTSGTYYNALLNYGGFTEDTRVIDDATYQALKDNPDYWTTDVNYARYNHDSAVETINSLWINKAGLNSTSNINTIKFKGAAGALTDGGAINTLTEEEIAVAAAKGWTVTLV